MNRPVEQQAVPQREYLSAAEAERVFPFCRRTWQRLAKSGRVRHFKVGSRVFFRVTDLNAFLESHAVDSREVR